MIYTSPAIHQVTEQGITKCWELLSNVHHRFSGTRNFIGIEFDKYFQKNEFDRTIWPQMRVSVADNFYGMNSNRQLYTKRKPTVQFICPANL
ncbi:MAG: hypothetical protein A1D16_02485 [Flavihumibacter sp. CACIAM 22H1]|nr:MAG: hypothetical protein A1D16_02485 [Flavihumibacter sp. CACIAM 22H1]